MSPVPPKALSGLAGCRARLEPAFESALDDLLSATEEVSRLETTLSDFAQASDPRAMQDLGRATGALEEGVGAVRAEARNVREASERLDVLIDQARRRLSALRQQTRMATLVAMNAQIVSVTTARSGGSLEGFAGDMRHLFERMRASTSDLSRDLDEQLAHARELRDLAQGLERQVRVDLTDDLAALVKRAGIVAADRRLARTSEGLTRRVSRLGPLVAQILVPMQIGDELRQRLEHVEAVIAEADRHSGAASAGLSELASRLLGDAVKTGEARLGEGRNLLEALSERVAALDLEAAFDAVRAGPAVDAGKVATLAERLAATVSTLDESRDRTRRAARAIRLPSARLDELRDLRHHMTLLAQNAILVSARSGEEGRAMEEVSQQLRRLTDEISGDLAALEQTLGELGAVSGGMADEAPLADVDLSATSELERLAGRIAATMPAEGGSQPVAELRSRLDRASATITHLGSTLSDLTALGGTVARDRPGGTSTGPPASVLDRLRALYTMEAERRLHDELFGTAPPEEDPVADVDLFDL